MMTRGSTLGRYEILHELGRGAIGAVCAARERSTGAVVALKTLDPALFNPSDAGFAGLFPKDARAPWRLSHPNIAKVLDAGEAGGTGYVAMELLEGESLRKILDERPLSIARAIQIADDIASGLAYAHEEGVVHRGVKPSNIVVLRSGGVKISDFRIGQLGEAAILTGQRAGCLNYLSPEQVRGDPVDGRSDIFSLGAVFYEMLTRRPAFPGDSPNEVVEKILHAELPLPSDVNPCVPRALDRIVLSMLAGHPDDRLPGARILLRDLRRLQEELGLGPGASAESDEPAATQPPPEHGAFRFLRHGQARDASDFRFRPDPPAVGAFQYRDRRPGGEAFDERDEMFMMDRESEPERSSGSRPAIFAALALAVAVVAIGVSVVLYDGSGPAPKPMPPEPLAAEASPPAQPEKSVARASEEPAATAPAPAQEAPRATRPTAKVAEPQPGGTAKLIVAVSPRGEVYIDGKHYGTTPPITTLDLEPGMRRIEVRSGSRKPYLTYMTVQAGDVRRIRHDFSAKPSRPPT